MIALCKPGMQIWKDFEQMVDMTVQVRPHLSSSKDVGEMEELDLNRCDFSFSFYQFKKDIGPEDFSWCL